MSIVRYVVVGLLFIAAPMTSAAQSLGPERYVRADLEAREATLDGMAERLAQLEAGSSEEVQQALAEDIRMRVDEAFARYGTSGAAHAAYGTRHAAAVAAWLEGDPQWQARYGQLDAEFGALSEQLDALRGGN